MPTSGTNRPNQQSKGPFRRKFLVWTDRTQFVCTYEQWQTQILNYFNSGQTSGVVEGINNKARVVTKRAYGIKSADTLWTRLLLDLNRAGDVVAHTIESLHELVCGFRAVFSTLCT